MKKALILLFSLVLLVSLTAVAVSAAGTEYQGWSDSSVPEWKPVYVPLGSYNASSVADCYWNPTHYMATLPEDIHVYDRIYSHANDPTRQVYPHEEYDMGMQFTAPYSGSFTVDFTGYVPQTQLSAGSDGMVIRVFDSTFTQKAELKVNTSDPVSLSETIDLAAGEKLYVFFNKGANTVSDVLVFTDLKVTGVAGNVEPQPTEPGNTDPTEPEPPAPTDPPEEPYYLTSKFRDIVVDEETNTLTLKKELTLAEFMTSFKLLEGHSIKVFAGDSEVTGDDTVITASMVLRVFKGSDAVADLRINTPSAPADPLPTEGTDPTEPAPTEPGAAPTVQENGVPVWAVILIAVGALLVGSALTALIMKKKGSK